MRVTSSLKIVSCNNLAYQYHYLFVNLLLFFIYSSLTGITAASPINSPSPKNSPLSKPLRRHSSQSSIDSVASDSQLLPKHKKHGRLERQLSNQSIQSTQSDRTDLQSHGISQVRRKSSSSDVNKSPGSLKPSSISRSQSSTTRTLSNEVIYHEYLLFKINCVLS